MEETTGCAKRSCVRVNDKQKVNIKLYKNNIPNDLMREGHLYSAKCIEQLTRGSSPNSVATKERFQKFQRVSEGLKPKALPEGYQSFSPNMKIETVKKLVNELYDELCDELAAAGSHGPVQGADIQADVSDTMQGGSGSARQLDMTVKEDVDMQVNNPGDSQVDEVPAAAPIFDFGNTLSNDTSLQNVACNQFGNPQARPHSRPSVPLAVHAFIFSDLMYRASRFPEIFLEFQLLEATFRSFVIQLESMEGALEDCSNFNLKSHQPVLHAKLEGLESEDAQNVTSMPSMQSLADEFLSNLLASPSSS